MRTEDLEKRALSLPGAIESAHFGKRDFRVGKRIFMSLPEAGRAVFKFTPDQQRMLLETEPCACAAVPGGWGEKGWTSVWFTDAEVDIIDHVMETAWRNVAPKSLLPKDEPNGKAVAPAEGTPAKLTSAASAPSSAQTKRQPAPKAPTVHAGPAVRVADR